MSRFDYTENSHGEELDGTGNIKPIPFDAHERAQAEQAADYEHQEFPKAVDHVDHPSGVGKQPIVVHSPEDEAAYFEAAAAKAARETDGKAEAEPTTEPDPEPKKPAKAEKKAPKLTDFDAE